MFGNSARTVEILDRAVGRWLTSCWAMATWTAQVTQIIRQTGGGEQAVMDALKNARDQHRRVIASQGLHSNRPVHP
eukprot:2105289-Rhodomonas_salina.1